VALTIQTQLNYQTINVLIRGIRVPLFFSVSNSKETPFLESCESSVLAGRAQKADFRTWLWQDFWHKFIQQKTRTSWLFKTTRTHCGHNLTEDSHSC